MRRLAATATIGAFLLVSLFVRCSTVADAVAEMIATRAVTATATGIGIETRPVMLVATLAVQELDTVCRVVAAHVRVRRTMIAPRVPLLCVLNATSRATARATAIILRVATTAATAD